MKQGMVLTPESVWHTVQYFKFSLNHFIVNAPKGEYLRHMPPCVASPGYCDGAHAGIKIYCTSFVKMAETVWFNKPPPGILKMSWVVDPLGNPSFAY